MKNYTTNHADAKSVDYRDVMGIQTQADRDQQANDVSRMMAAMPAEKRAQLEAEFAKQDAQIMNDDKLLTAICDAIMEADDSVCAEFKFGGMSKMFNIDIDGEKVTVDMDARSIVINNGASDEFEAIIKAMLK